MKLTELKKIIKEEIEKVLAENKSKPTHKSKVDWYYINDDSNYPGPKGRTVPNAEGFDNPKKYKGTELYIAKGTKGYVSGNKFEDEEGNDVQYKAEYFEKILAEAPQPQIAEPETDVETKPSTPTRRRTMSPEEPVEEPAKATAEKIAKRFKQGKK